MEIFNASRCFIIVQCLVFNLCCIIFVVALAAEVLKDSKGNEKQVEVELLPEIEVTLRALFTSQAIKDVKLFELYQSDFECCGLYESSDWFTLNKTIPVSCCIDPEDCTAEGVFYEVGCIPRIGDILVSFYRSLSMCAAIEIIGTVVNFSLGLLLFKCN